MTTFLEFECMTPQSYAHSHALICTHPKMAFQLHIAPHRHTQRKTEQVRLTRFFALPDSDTSQRVTIGVLGHVVVSQTGIVQVPYATVTVEYFRALSNCLLSPGASIAATIDYGLCSHGRL